MEIETRFERSPLVLFLPETGQRNQYLRTGSVGLTAPGIGTSIPPRAGSTETATSPDPMRSGGAPGLTPRPQSPIIRGLRPRPTVPRKRHLNK